MAKLESAPAASRPTNLVSPSGKPRSGEQNEAIVSPSVNTGLWLTIFATAALKTEMTRLLLD
jgi:hypothetical protein